MNVKSVSEENRDALRRHAVGEVVRNLDQGRTKFFSCLSLSVDTSATVAGDNGYRLPLLTSRQHQLHNTDYFISCQEFLKIIVTTRSIKNARLSRA